MHAIIHAVWGNQGDQEDLAIGDNVKKEAWISYYSQLNKEFDLGSE